MKMDKERMREYQKERRVKLKGASLTDARCEVGRPIDCLGCAELRGVVDQKDLELKGLKESLSVAPAGVCKGCSDRDMANAILRAKVLMLEKELGLLKREKKVEREEVPKSPYRLGPGV